MKKIERSFSVGSSWVYFKLYMSEIEANSMLATKIYSLIRKLKKDEIIDRWFFIRYYDPDFHIRLRCHLKHKSDFQKLITFLNDRIESEVKKGHIYKTTCETYTREISRYGEKTMNFSEYLFQINSEQTISLIQLFSKSPGDFVAQAVFPILIIDNLLDIFGYSINRKQNLLEYMWKSFAAEFNYSSEYVRLLSIKYREFKPILVSIMNREMCNKQIEFVEKTNATLKDRMKEEHLDEGIFNKSIMSSYIHMILNRYFNFAQRAHELVIYYSLFNYYKSAIKRLENESKNQNNGII